MQSKKEEEEDVFINNSLQEGDLQPCQQSDRQVKSGKSTKK